MLRRQRQSIFVLLIFIVILSISPTATSKTQFFPVKSGSSPGFWLDLGTFQGQKNNVQVEIYYSVGFQELVFEETSEGILASFGCTLSIKDAHNQIVYEDLKQRKTRAASGNEIKDATKGVIDVFVFDLPAGDYSLECQLMDNNSKATSQVSGSFQIPAYPDSLCMSDPQLATLISQDLSNKLFVKNNRTILPNPSCQYQYQNSLLYFYYQVYNLAISADSSDSSFNVSYTITNLQGDSLLSVPSQAVTKPGTSCVKMQALDIRGLEPGEYLLAVKVDDPASGQSASRNKSFWIHGPQKIKQSISMTKEDIQKYRDQIQYIATREELKIFDSLNPEGKANFLVNFWREKDTDPDTPENEFMQNYFSRIAYANTHFKGEKGGINTDMGRVFIVYGEPDDIENHLWESGIAPYKIWYYFTGGGKHSFVFIDRNNEGIYSLVHSTVQEEIKNEDWMYLESK